MNFTREQINKIIDNILTDTEAGLLKWKLKRSNDKSTIYYTKHKVTKEKYLYLSLVKRSVFNNKTNIYLDIYYHIKTNDYYAKIKINDNKLSNILTIFISEYYKLFDIYCFVKFLHWTSLDMSSVMYNKTLKNEFKWIYNSNLKEYKFVDFCFKGNCFYITLSKNTYQVRTNKRSIGWINSTPKKVFNLLKNKYGY